MKNIDKIKEKLLPIKYFDFKTIEKIDKGYRIKVYENCLVIKVIKPEIKEKLRKNPSIRILKTKDSFYAIQYFPHNIHKEKDKEENIKKDTFYPKYRYMLANLEQAEKKGYIEIHHDIAVSTAKWLSFEVQAKKFNEETDFNDDKPDTTYACLLEPILPYRVIQRISLNYNTFVVLKNAKVNKNKCLYHYLKKGTNAFYNDCLFHYLLLHSDLLNPEYFNFENFTNEVRIQAKELFKLYPNKFFKLQVPTGVKMRNISRAKAKKMSKNDVISFKFSDKYLDKYRNIITKNESNTTNPDSMLKIPYFFVAQALKQANLSCNGFPFLLWLLPIYRVTSTTPMILHSVRKIITETGMDTKHGYLKPLATLSKYLNWLLSVHCFSNQKEKFELKVKDLDYPIITTSGNYLALRKPSIKPPKEED